MVDRAVYARPMGRLIEHYAALLVATDGYSLATARMVVDTSPMLQGFLGRTGNYPPRYRELRALVLAGITTEDERAEWAVRLSRVQRRRDAVNTAAYAAGG